jgi:geranylgeranyl diphosphate synthase type II
MEFLNYYNRLRQAVEEELSQLIPEERPRTLYEPIRYILSGGGKRVRPVLTMMACEAVGGNPLHALHAGIAVEVLHNFTLVHDDIMDSANMRRNRPTVHKKWNDNSAILSGDCMMPLAYRILLKTSSLQRLPELISAFNTGVIEVCEGQAYDLEFAHELDITLDDYRVMIEKKTAKMLELAVVAGALVASAPEEHITALRQYAIAVGTGFQIQDDLLDAIANEEEFGKRIGGDIIEGKKTFLILSAQQKAVLPDDIALLEKFYNEQGLLPDDVPAMIDLFHRTGVIEATLCEVQRYMHEAHQALSALPDNAGKSMLAHFAEMLVQRTS